MLIILTGLKTVLTKSESVV